MSILPHYGLGRPSRDCDNTLTRCNDVPFLAGSDSEVQVRSFTICREDDPVPSALFGAIAAIGNFDGIHLGHRALITAVRHEAMRTSRPSVALTFAPHPRIYFAPDRAMFQLTSPMAKEIIFERLELDGLIILRFDDALAGMSASDFVVGILRDRLRLSGVVIGHDFHFGRGRQGNSALLAALCEKTGLSCCVIPAVRPDAGVEPISSSAIRAALMAGDVAGANRLLGYRWFVLGKVQHGEKCGRTLGYPTANLELKCCDLAHGINAVRVRLPNGSMYDGVASYGRRPTFDNGLPLLEVNLFGFAGDLYGVTIAVEFIGRIRGEERFESADALVARMKIDVAQAREIIARDRTVSML